MNVHYMCVGPIRSIAPFYWDGRDICITQWKSLESSSHNITKVLEVFLLINEKWPISIIRGDYVG